MMKFPVHSSWFPVPPAGGTRSRAPAAGKPSNCSMRTGPRSGTVLMETVLCLPLLLMLITGIWQFARIWEARLFTRYAAYNAARAALVYNVEDYAEVGADGGISKFKPNEGPVWLAAVNTLAWMSHSTDAGNYTLPGVGVDEVYPHSGNIRSQVFIDNAGSCESNGYVKVSVKFLFPLLIPIFDGGAMWGKPSNDLELVFDPVAEPDKSFTLTEACALPKPWSTRKYPRISDADYRRMPL